MKSGDMCVLIDVCPHVMGTIIRETKQRILVFASIHPYVNFMKAYDVLDVNGKLQRVSETFVRPVGYDVKSH